MNRRESPQASGVGFVAMAWTRIPGFAAEVTEKI